ncbi:MAG: SoxR reducing system RseC family protein [Chromatiales bacterium]|jgi:sigma-E factor negative regulatory protein RseC
MLEENATVVQCDADTVVVETISRSSCSHCSAGSCGTSVLGSFFGLRRNLLQLPRTIDVQPGDQVVVGIPDTLLVKASVWAYLAPVLCMIGAVLVAVTLGAEDVEQAMFALLGLAGGFYGVRYVLQRSAQRHQYVPVLLRRQLLTSVGIDTVGLHKPTH